MPSRHKTMEKMDPGLQVTPWKEPSQEHSSEESAQLREADLICLSFPRSPASTAAE